jgi:hypothetical protein
MAPVANDNGRDDHALLKAEADANFRSLKQEALARIDRSFAFDEQLSTETVNRLRDEFLPGHHPRTIVAAGAGRAGGGRVMTTGRAGDHRVPPDPHGHVRKWSAAI